MKHIYRITILFFACMLLLPILFFNLDVDVISAIDNKKLTEITDVGEAEDFTSVMEQFTTERIGFREQFLSIYLNGSNQLLSTLKHPLYTYGKDGYTFFQMKEETLDAGYLDTFARMLSTMQQYYTKKKVPFLYCINPSKKAVYREKLPDGCDESGVRMSYLKNKLTQYGVTFMDNTEYLREEAKTRQVFNRQYDAGHWNETGAYLGISNIMRTLHQMDERINPVDASQSRFGNS